MRQPINERFIKPVLDYNKIHKERIHSICEPLKYFGITHFACTRVFDGGRYLSISNSPRYQEAIFTYDYMWNTRFFKEKCQLFSKYEPYTLIWPENGDDEIVDICNAHNVHHGFNIVQENAGIFEFYFFGAEKDSPLIKNFYLDHSSLLEKFTCYFQKIVSDLLNPFDISKQGISPYFQNICPHIEAIFEKITPWEKEIHQFNKLLNSKIQEEIFAIGKRHSLTSQELKCLSYLSTGKTAKEIGRTLTISPRTVEAHINNLRLKTFCQTRSELTCWFEDTFHPFLKDLPLKGVVHES